MLRRNTSILLATGVVAAAALAADPVEIDELSDKMSALEGNLPAAATKTVSYSKDIQPLLEKSCVNCHGPKKRPKGKFRIDTRELALKGGSEGVSIIPGESNKSPLVYYISKLVIDFEMPPEGKKNYPPLTSEQVGLVRAWIDQGAKYDN